MFNVLIPKIKKVYNILFNFKLKGYLCKFLKRNLEKITKTLLNKIVILLLFYFKFEQKIINIRDNLSVKRQKVKNT